jgi:hypothetical protein
LCFRFICESKSLRTLVLLYFCLHPCILLCRCLFPFYPSIIFWFFNCCYFNFLSFNTLSSSYFYGLFPLQSRLHIWLYFAFLSFSLNCFLVIVLRQVCCLVFILMLESNFSIHGGGGELLAFRYVVQWWGCDILASGPACSSAIPVRML